ncbi:MAG: EFR1 family ferrodoxin [Spirochaetales bacterium]|nr:EFR1 family ferrodoxin [Spirochaetales bacterium]
MKNIIFCFSGTGNSLEAARNIADSIPGTEVVLIADAINDDLDLSPYERIGIACPGCSGNLSPIVERFLSRQIFHKDQYIFAVVTAGAIHGSSFDSIAAIVSRQGGALSAAYPLRMPGNYIPLYGAWPGFFQRRLLKNARKNMVLISRKVKHREKNFTLQDKSRIETNRKNRAFELFALGYHVSEACSSCGICVNVCPVNNIELSEGRPVFGEHCEQCMACIQWCPEKAINYKNMTENRKQYRNPSIVVTDLFTREM